MNARRRRRWPWILVAALLLLLVAVAVALPMMLDVERHRGRIESALREATGWEPELGALGFSVLRGLVLTVSPASLSAPEGGSRFEIDSLEVRARLLPLFRGELQVGSIELVRPSVTLVRPSEARGWVLPGGGDSARPGASPASRADGAAGSGGGGFTVSIERIDVSGGRVRLEDRAATPPTTFGVDDLDAAIYPTRSELNASARLPDDGGRIRAEGNWTRRLDLTLRDVVSAALEPFVGEGLIHPDTRLDGTVTVKLPDEIDGELEVASFALASGPQPLERADVTFAVRPAGEAWDLTDLTIRSGDVTVKGGGRVLPDLNVTLEIPDAPVESALAAARAVFPLPLELEPPGSASAIVDLTLPAGGDLTYAARGTLSSAGYRAAEFLPKVQELGTRFWLTPDGRLTIDVEEGRVAGGPLDGRVSIDSVSPLGTMQLEGSLVDAVFGGLLTGFIGESAEKISGPAGLRAGLALDLGDETIGVRSLAGGLTLDARQVSMPGWNLERAILRRIGVELAEVQALGALLGSDRLAKVQRELEQGGETVEEVLQSLSADVDFDALPWRLRDLGLTASGVTAGGKGTFDPENGAVDLELTARFDENRTRELVQRVEELEYLVGRDGRITLPLTVRGPLLRPTFGVAIKDVVERRVRAEKEDEVRSKVEQEVEKKLGEEARGLLKGLVDRERKKDE